MKVDEVPCFHCRRMFEPWTNEYYCSPACHTAAHRERVFPPGDPRHRLPSEPRQDNEERP